MTDHTPKDKKYFTTSKSEDEQFFNYKKSLEEYKRGGDLPPTAEQALKDKAEKFEIITPFIRDGQVATLEQLMLNEEESPISQEEFE